MVGNSGPCQSVDSGARGEVFRRSLFSQTKWPQKLRQKSALSVSDSSPLQNLLLKSLLDERRSI